MAKSIAEELKKKGIAPKAESKSIGDELKKKGEVPSQSITTDTPESKPGFFSRVATDLKERGKSIMDTWKNNAKTSNNPLKPLETGLQTLGAVAGGVGDVIGEGVTSLARGVSAITPNAIEDPIKQKILNNEIVKYGLELAKDGIGAYEGWKVANPNAAKNLESVINIATLFPAEKIGVAGVKAGTKGIGKAALVGSEILDSGLAKEATENALKIISPKLTTAEKDAAISAGRGEVKGLLKTYTLKPSKEDFAIADVIKDVVSPKYNEFTNISKINNKIKQTAQDLEASFDSLPEQGINSSYSPKEFEKFINQTKASSKILFGSDKALENKYDAVIETIIDLVNEKQPTLKNIWKSRKEFDDIIEEKFGANFLSNPVGDNLQKNAVRDVRLAANDFIANSLPEQSVYTKPLKDMSLMYKGIDNISNKATSKINTNILQRTIETIKLHPATSVAGALGVGYGLSSGGVIAILSSPVLLGTLMTYGTIKMGGKIITSRTLRESLSKFLRSIGNKIKIEDKKAIQEIMKGL